MLAELQNITKQYGQPGSGIRNVVLNEVSLAIDKKDSIAIVGPSGSGKSTLLNIIGLLDEPSKGRVELNGMEITKFNDGRQARLRNVERGR